MVHLIKRVICPKARTSNPTNFPSGARLIPRDQHCISRKSISSHALKVLHRLKEAGFEAFLVGGGVRDCLLGHEPKDFDIVTNARPEQVRHIFRNCRLIGKRFRLAHVYFKDEIIEVATFRGSNEENHQHTRSDQGVILRDNVYGSLEEDIWRRDFTINALYYNITDFSVLDGTGGMEDLQQGIVRIIGDPKTRYQEDPVRMLRAVRFAAKLGFTIDPATASAIPDSRKLLTHISNARLFDECLKLFLTGYASHTYSLLRHYDLFGCLFPETENCLSDQAWHQTTHTFLFNLFDNTDKRIDSNKSVSPAFIFSALLWQPIKRRQQQLQKQQQLKAVHAYEAAIDDILTIQLRITAIPRRITTHIREIWDMQYALIKHQGNRPLKLITNPCFRAAFDFLNLAAIMDPELVSILTWWETFIQSNDRQRKKLCAAQKPPLTTCNE